MLPGDTNACNRGKKGTNKHSRATLIVVINICRTKRKERRRKGELKKNDEDTIESGCLLNGYVDDGQNSTDKHQLASCC